MNRYFLILLVLFGLMIIAACGGGSSGVQQRPVMYALVNNANWRSPSPNAVISEHTIDVFGTSSNGQSIHIKILSGETGEYYLGITQGHFAKYTPNMSPGTVQFSTNANENGTGFVRISSINEDARTISGNFNFKAYRASDNTFRNIADGNFSNVPYRFIYSSDTTSFTSVLTCIDNGNVWNATNVNAVRNDTAIVITAEIPSIWESIKLIFPAEISAGVHYISSLGPVYSLFQKGFYTYLASNGSSTIIEHNPSNRKLRGSFFFNYVNIDNETRSVTSGQFEVEYTIPED